MTSAWSVVVSDDWMRHNYGTVPVDEELIMSAHMAGSTMFGCRIDNKISSGIYPAELQAICRALALLPLSYHINIISDSLSSLMAIRSFHSQLNPRRRLRVSARPLLLLIHRLIEKRQHVTGDQNAVRLNHVRSHTTHTDIHSVGNRMADYCAGVARARSSDTADIKQLPLESCERHMYIKQADGLLMIDDARRTALIQLKSHARYMWDDKHHADMQGRFASATSGIEELGRIIMKYGSSSAQSTLIHVVTNSIHLVWLNTDDDTDASSLCQLTCKHCNDEPMTLDHFAICPHVDCVRHRQQMQHTIIDILMDAAGRHAHHHDDADWFVQYRDMPLTGWLHHLFPPNRPTLPQKDTTTLMIGAYTVSEVNNALRGTSLKEHDFVSRGLNEYHHPINRMRVALIEWIGQVYHTFKQSLLSQS